MGELPKDPVILLSVVNTKLRDFYPTLEALCEDMNVDSGELQTALGNIGYIYNAELNRFM